MSEKSGKKQTNKQTKRDGGAKGGGGQRLPTAGARRGKNVGGAQIRGTTSNISAGNKVGAGRS